MILLSRLILLKSLLLILSLSFLSVPLKSIIFLYIGEMEIIILMLDGEFLLWEQSILMQLLELILFVLQKIVKEDFLISMLDIIRS